MTVAVFLGPSLPRPEAETILAADYRPPVRQGDIYRLVKQGKPQAIAVIDGYFQEVPSVWHKEILWALDQGIPVYGAASMGALRAAELQPHGMVGVGKIYEAYRLGTYDPYSSEVFEDDDEVAVIHGPAELSYPALSDAMVDLRETWAAAARAGIIDEALRDALSAAFKRRFYRARSFDALPEVLAELAVAAPVADALLNWLPDGRISQKRADARALLEALASAAPALPPEREPFVFERTSLWAQFVEQSQDPSAAITAAERLVLEELRLDPASYRAMRNLAALWQRLDAGEALAPVDDHARRQALDRLRRRHGLLSREALEAWAEDGDLDRAGLDRLLTYEVALGRCAAEAGPAARARDKETLLGPPGETAAAPSALSSEALLDWYFEDRLGCSVPEDVKGYAEERGFGSLNELLVALARERAYLALSKKARGEGAL